MTRGARTAGVTVPVAMASLVGLCACGPAHIAPHTPRHRDYRPGAYERAPREVSPGSLWQDSSRSLVADFRASRVGDLVTIRVDESPQAAGDAATAMDRSSNQSFGAPKLLGFAQALQEAHPDLDTDELINLMSQASFAGAGETTRGSRVRASIAARVRRQMPNGDLFIEGTKVLMVNDEELHIYVSGVIRPQDIEQDNSVLSNLIADAQIEFTGRGVLTDNQKQGWLARLVSAINPF
ncbi:MAG: flagellar basal body L-ring protein FlgH [Myxococcales bacterium]|nr:flagellar basal body L-ring protein FlgH [Myxococcales bacterium]